MRTPVDRPTVLLAGVVLFLSFGGTAYLSIVHLLEHQRRVERTEQVLAETHELLELFVDAQIGQRGYIIAGSAEYARATGPGDLGPTSGRAVRGGRTS